MARLKPWLKLFTMFPVRRLLFIMAAAAFAVSSGVYAGSYVGLTMDRVWKWAIVLHGGVFVFLVAMNRTESGSFTGKSVFGKQFLRDKPKWAVRGLKLLGCFALMHFVVFLVQSHAASPEVINGQYVLNNHGRIVEVLTPAEYVHLKAAELRLFASGWLFCYFVCWVQWWFPQG